MKRFSTSLVVALIGTALISSCSRPVAYFQPTAREQFKSVKTEIVAAKKTEMTQPMVVEAVAPAVATETVSPAMPTEQIAQAKQAVEQLDAYVRNDSKLASNKKLAKRMNRVREFLSSTTPKAAESVQTTSLTKKTTLLEKVMLKRIDKKIKNHLSPEKTMAKSLLTIGAIVGIIGLILLLLNVANPLGLIALIVGLALVLVDLLR